MMSVDNVLTVLNLGDSSSESLVLQERLTTLGMSIFFKRVDTLEDLVDALHSQNWNLVISDYHIKNLYVLDALDIVRSKCPDLPFILVSEGIGEEAVADMMNAGVEDFVSKSRLERLIPAVKRILREHETRAKEVQAQRMANMAYAAKEQMLAIVSHDIKNPLSAIRLEAQMLLRVADRHEKSVLSEEVKIQGARILKTTDRLRALISDLLDKNKTENGLANLTKSEVSVAQLIQEVLDTCRPHFQEKSIQLKGNLPPSTMMLSLDRNKMFQVFSNLLSNAIKFTPEKGSIKFSCEERENDVAFTVIDSGSGLKEEELPRVFEKYWTGRVTGGSGTGLGLFICKTIVDAHGGEILVENSKEGGARFFFNIPKSPSTSIPFFEKRKEDPRKRILIIDDDEDLREVMCWALGKEGYVVQSFGDPHQALNSMQNEGNLPHIILADYHMDGMKGGEFLKMKYNISHVQHCPVVMISASPSEIEREVEKKFYKEVITKPVDLEGLVENMKRYLN